MSIKAMGAAPASIGLIALIRHHVRNLVDVRRRYLAEALRIVS